MKIYFCASVRAGRQDFRLYRQIVLLLGQHGVVLTKHLADEGITSAGEMALDDAAIYRRDRAWLGESDVVVAEVSVPSLGVGMELGYADASGKPTLCLNRRDAGRKLSAMVAGCPRFAVASYGDIEEIPVILSRFFSPGS